MKRVKFGEIIQFNPSLNIKKETVVKKIAMEELLPHTKKILGFQNAVYSTGPKFQNGDTLLAKITPCLENGKTAFVDILDENEVAFGSSEFIVLRAIENVTDANYVYYLARSPKFRNRAISCMEGTSGRKRVKDKNLQNEIFYLPALPIQTAIAKVLSSLDDKIELNKKINKELEATAKELYDYWFVQNVNEKWEKKSLYDIAVFTNGLACQKFRPRGKDFYKVIKIKEMRDGFTENTELVDVDIPQKVIVNDGDILFSWSASLEVMIWTGGVGGLNQHIFKVTSDEFPKSFIYFQLLNYLNYFRIIADNRKTTMGHITIDHLKQSEIYIPPKKIIEKIDKIVSPIFSAIIKNRQESANLAQFRDFLLPLLMNGQVKVSKTQTRPTMVPFKKIDNDNTKYQTWKEQTGIAARGGFNEQTIHNIYEAIDENDK